AANFFAAELLLPFERIRTLYLVERVSPDRLANIFGVSPAALLNRLAGLLKPPVSTASQTQKTHQTSTPTNKGNSYPKGTRLRVEVRTRFTAVPPRVPSLYLGVASARSQKRYDEFQQAAIQTSTPALIVAGPGSGKTSTLNGRIEYLIDSLNI